MFRAGNRVSVFPSDEAVAVSVAHTILPLFPTRCRIGHPWAGFNGILFSQFPSVLTDVLPTAFQELKNFNPICLGSSRLLEVMDGRLYVVNTFSNNYLWTRVPIE